jgi:DNA-binding NarL/FixJ family response regulator
MIRVLVVEDQTLIRQGVCSLLSLADDIEVVGESTDGVEALAAIERLRPDVVLLDVRMPRMDGLEVLRCLHEKGSQVPVLVLTTFDDDEALFEALRSGAKGYLLKEVSLDQLASAIRALAEGGDLVHPALSSRAARGLAGKICDFPSQERPDPLTRRERAVLRLLAAGCSNREIASALNLAHGTVKNYISSILSKLGVRDRTRAVLRAFELRYL